MTLNHGLVITWLILSSTHALAQCNKLQFSQQYYQPVSELTFDEAIFSTCHFDSNITLQTEIALQSSVAFENTHGQAVMNTLRSPLKIDLDSNDWRASLTSSGFSAALKIQGNHYFGIGKMIPEHYSLTVKTDEITDAAIVAYDFNFSPAYDGSVTLWQYFYRRGLVSLQISASEIEQALTFNSPSLTVEFSHSNIDFDGIISTDAHPGSFSFLTNNYRAKLQYITQGSKLAFDFWQTDIDADGRLFLADQGIRAVASTTLAMSRFRVQANYRLVNFTQVGLILDHFSLSGSAKAIGRLGLVSVYAEEVAFSDVALTILSPMLRFEVPWSDAEFALQLVQNVPVKISGSVQYSELESTTPDLEFLDERDLDRQYEFGDGLEATLSMKIRF